MLPGGTPLSSQSSTIKPDQNDSADNVVGTTFAPCRVKNTDCLTLSAAQASAIVGGGEASSLPLRVLTLAVIDGNNIFLPPGEKGDFWRGDNVGFLPEGARGENGDLFPENTRGRFCDVKNF